jgi:hypothetical protein
MVSTSVSDLHVSFGEGKDCLVQCDAFFGHHLANKDQFQRVEIAFDGAVCCRILAIHCDSEMPGGQEYDWSKVFVHPKTEDELENQLRSRRELWESTGLCPNPNFYGIDRSSWAGEYGNQFLHFLLTGTDSYVEVLALSFRWSSIHTLGQ